jgi:hypothetical protein
MLRAAALARIFNKRALLEKDSASLVPKFPAKPGNFSSSPRSSSYRELNYNFVALSAFCATFRASAG